MTVDQLGTLITELEQRVTELEAQASPAAARKAEPELSKKDTGRHDK